MPNFTVIGVYERDNQSIADIFENAKDGMDAMRQCAIERLGKLDADGFYENPSPSLVVAINNELRAGEEGRLTFPGDGLVDAVDFLELFKEESEAVG